MATRLTGSNRHCLVQKPKQFTIWPLTEKICHPLYSKNGSLLILSRSCPGGWSQGGSRMSGLSHFTLFHSCMESWVTSHVRTFFPIHLTPSSFACTLKLHVWMVLKFANYIHLYSWGVFSPFKRTEKLNGNSYHNKTHSIPPQTERVLSPCSSVRF